MVGSGGIDVISVALADPAAEGPELLIGENADMLDLPPREDLAGWRILFRPDDRDGIVVYAGGPDDAVMVRRAVEFASANGFLPRQAKGQDAR